MTRRTGTWTTRTRRPWRRASMQPAKYAGERHQEKLLALLVARMQAPGPPVVRAVAVHERTDDALRAQVRLGQVLGVDSARIQDELIRIGAMEIDVRHGRLRQRTGPDPFVRLKRRQIERSRYWVWPERTV